MLNCQYSARVLFNRAEKYSYFTFIISIFSALCVFLNGNMASFLIPVITSILSVVTTYLMKKNQKLAAMIRNYFDANVLGINDNNYSETEVCKIASIVEKIISKSPKKHSIQISHTGKDDPPGVKDWYQFSKDYPGNEAVFECQKQNCWWNDRLCKNRITILMGLFIVFIVIYCLITHYLKISFFHSLLCVISLLLGLGYQIVENITYLKISNDLNVLLNVPNISQNEEQLYHIQARLNDRRELAVLEINWLHRRTSKTWSEQYERITNY